MIFTTITNGEGDAMRQLEKKDAGTPAKTAAKGAAKAADKPSARKRSEAQLVLANGEMGEGARLGLSLVGAGVTAFTVGLLEGLARRGHAQWWRDLSPSQRGLILMAFTIIAGLTARHRRKQGHVQSALGLEAAAIGAWTVAIIYFTEEGIMQVPGKGGAPSAEIPQGALSMGVDELKALDKQIDDDIRDAARRLREMAEREREERSYRTAPADRADEEDLGLLAYQGESDIDDSDDDEDFF